MRGFIFDLDGTVYIGNRLIDGAAETIRSLRERGDRVLFVTNGPLAGRDFYAEKLNRLGIPVEEKDVINSVDMMIKYLKSVMQENERAFVIAEDPVREALEKHGISICRDPLQARYAVVAWDRQFTYDKLRQLYRAAANGAVVAATNIDRRCPAEDGIVPDTGALVGALEAATGKSIDFVAGKPSLYMAEEALKRLGVPRASCYLVGDSLESDIRMGRLAGMHTILVLSGMTTREMLRETMDQPRYVVDNIRDVLRFSKGRDK